MPINLPFMQVSSRLKLGNNPQPNVAEYSNKACTAIRSAISLWQVQAKFKDLKIMAVSAIGTPGCLDGPNLGGLAKPFCPQSTQWERDMTNVVAPALGSAWATYQRSVIVPGLPWYPAFAAWPGPMAPPTPNIPTPFLALPQRSGHQIANDIKSLIKAASSVSYADAVADAVSAGFLSGFLTWVSAVMVMNVLGKGPVPSFAPPYVPVGPVIGGDNIAVPGHLMG
jgi:hypothetical protein